MNRRDLIRSLAGAAVATVLGPPLLTTAGGPAPLTSRLRAKMRLERDRWMLYFVTLRQGLTGVVPLWAQHELLFGSGEREAFWATVKALTVPYERWAPGQPILDHNGIHSWLRAREHGALATRAADDGPGLFAGQRRRA